jgi:hypothetical protein
MGKMGAILAALAVLFVLAIIYTIINVYKSIDYLRFSFAATRLDVTQWPKSKTFRYVLLSICFICMPFIAKSFGHPLPKPGEYACILGGVLLFFFRILFLVFTITTKQGKAKK